MPRAILQNNGSKTVTGRYWEVIRAHHPNPAEVGSSGVFLNVNSGRVETKEKSMSTAERLLTILA